MLSRFPRRAEAALFLALSVAAAGLSMTAVAGSLAHVGRPFPGFVVWRNLVVVALGRESWTGLAARVPFRARVVSVDGRPVATRDELAAVVRATPAGTPHAYVFEGPHGSESRTVASMVLSGWDYAATMGVYLFNGLGFLTVGLAVFYLKPESRQSRALLAFGTVWGLTLVLCVDLFTAGLLDRLYLVLEALSPAAGLHLALTFPELRGPVRRSAWPLAWLYGAGLLVGLAQVWLFSRSYRALILVNDGVYLGIAVGGVALMAAIGVAAGRGATPIARRRARVVLAGALLAFLLPVLALLAFLGVGQPVSFSLLALTGFLFPLSIGYAVARHDLFEADRFVKLSLVWAGTTALVSLAYGGSVLLADRVAAGLALTRSPLFPIGFILVALATVVPLRERVQRAVDRLFYRGRVDFKQTVARASERMTTLLDRDAIVQHVTSTIRDVLFVPGASLWESEKDGLVRRGPTPAGGPRRLPLDDPGLQAFERLGRMLSRNEIEESLRLRAERPALRTLTDALGATLLVPLLRSGRPAGLLAVGPKASGGLLSADDVDVLRTLANETAVALGNAAAVEELQEARERLARAEGLAAIGELSAAVAHGIRNPLAGIRLAAQLGLERAPTDDVVHENLTDVLTEVDKLEAQVRGILDFARPFEPNLEPTDVRALIAGVVDTLASRVAAAGVTVDVDVARELPPVRADRTHLSQVLHELLANALDATSRGGRVTVAAAVADGDGRVRLTVTDSGPGVPPDMRDRVFQLFMTTKATGTGVGLAVARKIVERHGGTIRLEGAAPHGARFVIELPAA